MRTRKPHRPHAAADFPESIVALDATDYRNPDQLPPGRVLVVGSGQTGVQLAEELHLAGRDPVLACGRAPWLHRRIGARDVVSVLSEAGFFDQPRSALPSPAARLVANVQATGARGGHDLHFRVLQKLGVQLTGHLEAVSHGLLRFAGDLSQSVAFGDERYDDIRRLVRDRLGSVADQLPDPEPFRYDPSRRSRSHPSAPSSSPQGSGRITAAGCTCPSSTTSASRSWPTT